MFVTLPVTTLATWRAMVFTTSVPRSSLIVLPVVDTEAVEISLEFSFSAF